MIFNIDAINVKKMGEDFFKDIGLVICDEIHLIMAEKLSSCMQFIFPRYLIGLSATPHRKFDEEGNDPTCYFIDENGNLIFILN